MNIEQMLRDAIESKTAKILKEEYGIELSKEFADKLPKDDQETWETKASKKPRRCVRHKK